MNIEQIVQTFGYVGLFAIIFAESGLFFGFFLPGDSLLLTAGLLAWRVDPATGHPFLSLPLLLVILPIAAILTLEPDRGINFFTLAPRLLPAAQCQSLPLRPHPSGWAG